MLSGLYRPTNGRLFFDGQAVTRLQPNERAGRGIGRTFQNVRLFTSMSVLGNIIVGAERPGNTRLRHLALIGASYAQMARNLGCSADTLERRYRPLIEEARGDGEVRILARTFQAALAGNMRALELSLVNRCGWALRPEMVINVNQNTVGLSAEEIPAAVLQRHRQLLLELAREDEARSVNPAEMLLEDQAKSQSRSAADSVEQINQTSEKKIGQL